MVTITRDRNGNYLIKIRGFRTAFKAKTIQELHTAIDHYFNNPHDEANCILCKEDGK